MPGSLDTTNTMLAIIAAVSVLQGLVLLGLGFAGWKIYKVATETLREIDERRVKPIAAKVDGLLDRVHQVTDRAHQITERVQKRAEKVEAALDDTMGRVNHTVSGAKTGVADTVHRVSDVVTGLRTALVNALTTDEGNGHRQQSAFAPAATTGVHRAEPAAGQGQLHTDETRQVREGGF